MNPTRSVPAAGKTIFTVARLNGEARSLLESGLGLVWVEGELSNLARPASGHLYFSLKDSRAQVRCAMFRQRNRALTFTPRDGLKVLVRARVSLYEPRGDFQLQVDHMEAGGDGALRIAFEQLKARLAAEGLFDDVHKRPLPTLPRRLGVITSPSGAVIRDILNVLRRRFPALPVLIYPVAVQGDGAAEQIASALALAGRRGDCDVLILARGGGSLEDLWPFNEETVARAIRACPVPVVSAVGHETDVTIADFAADLRAPTPSAAAELVAPDRAALSRQVEALQRRATLTVSRHLTHLLQQHRSLTSRLNNQHPGQRLRTQAQRLDELESRLAVTVTNRIRASQLQFVSLRQRLHNAAPSARLTLGRSQCLGLSQRLRSAMTQRLQRAASRLAVAGRALDSVSPLATLERGYAIVSSAQSTGPPAIVRDVAELAAGDRVRTQLARGSFTATIDTLEDDDNQ